MKIAPKPQNEPQRLKALYEYDILDTPAEAIFDLITSIATKVCDTPIGLITLIDADRQWFKSKVGLGGNEVSRDVAFCAHTILERNVLEVKDAKNDDRFHDNPYVTSDPNIRFYAGMPLVNQDGYALGALCVLDKKPKNLSVKQKEILNDLADIVIKLFEQKRAFNDHLQQLKQIEQQLREQKNYSENIFISALNGIVTFDKHGQIQISNPAFNKMFGYEQDQLADYPLVKLLPAFEYLGCDGKIHETAGLNKKGQKFLVEVFVSCMQIAGNDVRVGFIRDITKFKEVERMKNEFIALTSHELRTPITAIKGALEMLNDLFTEKDTDANALLKIALRNCDRLIRLINDILDIKKIESGNIKLNLKVEAIDLVIHESIEANTTFANKFGVALKFENRITDLHVCIDHDRFMQVMTNLLSNAVKFSPRGEVVTVSMKMIDNEVQVAIQDKGPGIPEEFRDKVFQKFFQAHQKQATHSTGLGLAISKAIIEELDGTIGFATEVNKGTTFYINLPVVNKSDKANELCKHAATKTHSTQE